MKVLVIAVLSTVVLVGCGHYRQTMTIDAEGLADIRPTKKYRIAAVRELYKGKDVLARWSGNDEASLNIRAFYKQREKEFIDDVYGACPDVFTDGGEPITVVRNLESQNAPLGFTGVLNILVSIPTLLTIPIFYESEWSSYVTVEMQGVKAGQNRVTERIEMRQTGPIPIALCFPYSNPSDAFCVTGVKANNARTEAMRRNEGKANGAVIIKQLIDLENNPEKGAPTIKDSVRGDVGQRSTPHAVEPKHSTKSNTSVVELEQIPL